MAVLSLREKFGVEMVCGHDLMRSQCLLCKEREEEKIPKPKRMIILKPRGLEEYQEATPKLSKFAFERARFGVVPQNTPHAVPQVTSAVAIAQANGLSQGPSSMASGPSVAGGFAGGISGGMSGGASGASGGPGGGGPGGGGGGGGPS